VYSADADADADLVYSADSAYRHVTIGTPMVISPQIQFFSDVVRLINCYIIKLLYYLLFDCF